MSIVGELFSEWVRLPTEDESSDLPKTVSDFLEGLTHDVRLLQGISEKAGQLYRQADDRRETIERKATTILGSTGVAASLLTASAGILLNRSEFAGKLAVLPFGLFLILTLVVLLYAAYKALRAMRVAGWGSPDPSILYQEHADPEAMERLWVAHVLTARAHNDDINNEKGGWLKEAQAWFVLGIFFLVLTGLALVLISAFAAAEPTPTSSP